MDSIPAVAQATSTIPIVFAQFSDVLAQNYVASFARPGGNIMGFTCDEATLVGKRLEILKEISSRMTRVLYVRGARPMTLLSWTLAQSWLMDHVRNRSKRLRVLPAAVSV
jgi:ABC-type uncharacterized transport system substrate-binding protein